MLQHEQLRGHEHHIAELEQELQLHRAAAPEKGSKSTTISSYIEKESYLEFEVRLMSAPCCGDGGEWAQVIKNGMRMRIVRV